jgi:hypothetical protein
MKKVLLTIVSIIIFQLSFSQKFNNIPIEGNISDFVLKITQKGYKLEKYFSKTSAKLTKKDNPEIELFINSTPITKKMYKVSLYLQKYSNWYSLKSEYERWKQILTEKHGTPTNSYEYFKEPYYEGDGYEIQAVSNEKVVFSSYWFLENENLNVALCISQFNQINIIYENQANVDIKEREKNKLDSESF